MEGYDLKKRVIEHHRWAHPVYWALWIGWKMAPRTVKEYQRSIDMSGMARCQNLFLLCCDSSRRLWAIYDPNILHCQEQRCNTTL